MGIIAETWCLDERVQVNVRIATGLNRLTGLIGRELPGPAAALAFDHCRSVHGIGMTRALDVVFVREDGLVSSVRRLAPVRFVADRDARWTLEFRAGEAARLGVRPGSRIKKISRQGG